MKRAHAKSVLLARAVAVTAVDAAKAADNRFQGSLPEASYDKARDAKSRAFPFFGLDKPGCSKTGV
jgi:hypothetical protein